MKRTNKFLTLLVLVALLVSACQPIVAPVAPEPMALPEGGAIVQTNDIATYYEIHGAGEPLLFMPGDFRTTEDVAELTDLLAKEYQVIVMDPRGRGRSSDSTVPLTMDLMADDAVALLDTLGIEKAHVVSWSSSAVVGLNLAMRYPERVDKLVLHGPNYTVDGLAPDHLAWFKSLNMAEMVPRFEEQYNRTAPDPDHLLTMLNRFQDLLLREPNYTLEMLSQIQAPTLVIDGDLDDWLVREHLEILAATIPNGQLVILPELGHFAPFEDAVAWTDAVLAFLNEPVAATTQIVPRFEPAECNYAVPEGDKMECGYLIVPEDRSDPDGPTIRLHVVNFKSLSDSPKPDPIFVVHGGPGATGHLFAWWFTSDPWGPVLRAERDIIYLEYRGTNFSEPAFYCPELEADLDVLAAMSFGEEIESSAAAVQACAQRTRQEGHNLSAYNPLAVAADLADLRTALGYDKVNVFGLSYGTVVSMLWMHHYPEGIRSVILDSVGPPNVNWLDAQLEVVDGALHTLFEACAADPACNTAYPDLKTAFSTVLTNLRQAPVTVTVEDGTDASYEIEIDDEMFVSYVREGMFFADGFTTIPAGIYAAYRGDFALVGAARLGFLQDRHGETGPGTWAMSKGAYYTNMCTLYGSFTDMEHALAIYDSVESDPSVYDWAVNYILTDTLAACEYWQAQPPTPNVWDPTIESESPVLMLVGTFDSDSAPLLSEPYRDAFANGYYYELPFGHVSMMSPCGLELMSQFLADPTQAPDASCIDAMTPNWVLPE